MPELNAIGIVASDMARSIRFYRLLGVDVPETPQEGHIDTFLASGVRFMLDSEEVVKSFRPEWARETGNQIGDRARVRERRRGRRGVCASDSCGLRGREGAVGRILGSALRAAPRPRRRPGRPLRSSLIRRREDGQTAASHVDERERHLDHALEVGDGDVLVGRVDLHHPVREVDARAGRAR